MRRSLLVIFTAILALCGCSKTAPEGGREITAVFKIAIDEPKFKGADDSDGTAAAVNRYIMEVYHAGSTNLYERVVKTVEAGTKLTEIPVTLVVGADYNLVFWADCGNADGSDRYYETSGNDGLRKVRRLTLNHCNDDILDAFSNSVTRTAGPDLGEIIWLKRPFAQVNVITEDLDAILKDNLLPKSITLSYKAQSSYDCLAGSPVGDEVEFKEIAAPYYQTKGQGTNMNSWTLAMDYIFAPDYEYNISRIGFLVKTGADDLPWCTFENIPLRANYRTNIRGALMTYGMEYTVVVDAIWDGEINPSL